MKRHEWFKSNFRYLHVRLIEKELGFRFGTLQKWVQGERNLNESRVIALDKFLDGPLFGVGISGPNIRLVDSPVIDEVRERILKEEKESPNPLLAVKRIVGSNRISKKEPKLPTEVKEKLNDDLNKIIENKNEVAVPIDMSTVDVTTGEIKEKLTAIRPNWLFNRVDSTYEVVEPWISKSGNLYEVKRMFANTPRYIYVNNLEDARRLVYAKNPLLVELSIK